MINESRISYIPISSQIRQTVPFRLKQTHLTLQDYDTINLNQFTVIKKSNLFKLEKMPLLPLEEKDLSWINVTFEMDLDRTDYSRSRYTALDLLAAFGGFMGIFRWIFGTFMQAWNF